VTRWGIHCQYAPRISNELKKLLVDMLRAKVQVNIIYDIHCHTQMRRLGDSLDQTCRTFASLTLVGGRDDFLCKRDLHNLKVKVLRENVRLHEDDATSVHMWVTRNTERLLVYREHRQEPVEQDFLLALQSPWQLAQMVHLSHGKGLAMDSTFATNKYGVSGFSVVCFLSLNDVFPTRL
jgi:hypothetical protein